MDISINESMKCSKSKSMCIYNYIYIYIYIYRTIQECPRHQFVKNIAEFHAGAPTLCPFTVAQVSRKPRCSAACASSQWEVIGLKVGFCLHQKIHNCPKFWRQKRPDIFKDDEAPFKGLIKSLFNVDNGRSTGSIITLKKYIISVH